MESDSLNQERVQKYCSKHYFICISVQGYCSKQSNITLSAFLCALNLWKKSESDKAVLIKISSQAPIIHELGSFRSRSFMKVITIMKVIHAEL